MEYYTVAGRLRRIVPFFFAKFGGIFSFLGDPAPKI